MTKVTHLATIEVHGLVLVTEGAMHTLFLETNLPETVWPFSKKPATVSMKIASSHTKKYIQDNFPTISIEINGKGFDNIEAAIAAGRI